MTIDVCGIGSALVDILVEADASAVAACGLSKGSMQLVTPEQSARIRAAVPGGVERSGGSCANTIAGLASLGAHAAFIGHVADDHFGSVFIDDLGSLGVGLGVASTAGAGETGRSVILVTPDADRTMCTTLGVAAHLAIDHLDHELIAAAAITYLEGYLWDEPVAIEALQEAIATAHAAGRNVAMSLSDPFCVERHRPAWQALAGADLDLLFGNEAELCSLTGASSLEEACEAVRRPGLIVTVTRGPAGAWAFDGLGPIVSGPAVETAVVDTTGAGDLYAAGFLHGLVRGAGLEQCIRFGTVAAAEVISHIGARPLVDLRQLVAGA